jgi:hypothetical protein
MSIVIRGELGGCAIDGSLMGSMTGVEFAENEAGRGCNCHETIPKLDIRGLKSQ